MTSFLQNDPFGAMESPSMPWDALFTRHMRRGGGRVGTPAKSKDDSAGDAAQEELVPDGPGPEEQPAEAERPESRLFNPAWGAEQGYFNEKAVATVEGELPPESSHLTRVTFTLRAVKDGKSEIVGTKEAHLEGGKAAAEFDLWIPQFRDEAGNLVQECEYVFSAKHRDSAEIESPALLGRPRSNGLPPDAATAVTTIEVVLLQEGNRPRAEEKYILTDAAGTVFQGVTDKDGRLRVEDAAPGEAAIVFPGLELLAAAATHVAAGAGGLSSFYLRIQMDPEEAKRLEEKFILASGDGAFTQTRTADDELLGPVRNPQEDRRHRLSGSLSL